MKRFLLLALTAGLFSPLVARADIKDSGGYKACIAGLRAGWKQENPSTPTTPELEGLFDETCLCTESKKNQNLTDVEAVEKCFSEIWLKEGEKVEFQYDPSTDQEVLDNAIDQMVKILMEKDKRYTKTTASKLVRCIMTSGLIDRATRKETTQKCKHLLYPDTPNLFE